MDAAHLDVLADREKIGDCLARLSRGEDRRDAELIRRCYWPDATDDHGVCTDSTRADHSETFFK